MKIYQTPERLALAKELWPQRITTPDILDRLNELPGKPVNAHHIRNWMQNNGICRDPAYARELIIEGSIKGAAKARALLKKESPGVMNYTKDWPFERVWKLIELKTSGLDRSTIGARLGCSVMAVVGKTHRLVQAGLLSGVPVAEKAEKPVVRELPRAPRLPPLPSQTKEAVVIELPPSTMRRSLDALFAGRPIAPLPRPEPKVGPYIPASRKCCFPLWSDTEKPTHIYCEAPVFRRAYCFEHSRRCYTNVRQSDAA
jgi:hypothetical protein